MRNTLHYFTILTLVTFMLVGCTSDKAPELKPLDLLSHGLPITIMAPDSAVIKKSFSGLMDELTISSDDNFGLLVQSYTATSTDVTKIKAEELALAKGGKFFSKIIQEDEAGFLYETAIDSVNVNYEFFYVKIQGDKEYRFMTPYTNNYTQEEVARIYNSLFEKK